MKRTLLNPYHTGLYTLGITIASLTISQAATITPAVTGTDAVAAAIAGRENVALAATGAVPFSSSDLNGNYALDRLNDGVVDNTGNSWIQGTPITGDYAGVKFAAPATVAALVFHGQPGYNGRSGGTWSLQYTTEADPVSATAWTEIGDYVYAEAGCASPMPRSMFTFPPINNVTGVKLLIKNVACSIELAVQEIEVYGPVAGAPEITAQPVGGTVAEGDDFVLSVIATAAEAFQWKKNGVNIPGATGAAYVISNVSTNAAGEYTVEVFNSAGKTTSAPVTLTVTPGPVFPTYEAAVLADSPIHYYRLDDTNGTKAADLGTLATEGGTYTGGVMLGQPAATPKLGTAVRFDGAVGTYVDLGLFHPGDTISVEAWVMLDTDAVNTYSAIVARWDGSYELDFATSTPNFVVRNESNGFGLVAGKTSATRSQWHHLVGIFSQGVLTIYVDGVKGTEQTIGGVLQNAGPDLVMIGATREKVLNWKGLIDEVAIYDTALTPVQIRAHYRTALTEASPEVSIQNAVIVSWPSFPPGYALQGAAKVDGPYTAVTNTPISDGSKQWLALPQEANMKYFRLQKP